MIDTYRSRVWSNLKRGYWVWLFLRWKNVWKTIQQRESAGVGVWDDTVTVDQSLSTDHEVTAFRMLQRASLFTVGLMNFKKKKTKHYYRTIHQDLRLSHIFDCYFLHIWMSVLSSHFWKCLTVWKYLIRYGFVAVKDNEWMNMFYNPAVGKLQCPSSSLQSRKRTHAFMFPALRNDSFFFFLSLSLCKILTKHSHMVLRCHMQYHTLIRCPDYYSVVDSVNGSQSLFSWPLVTEIMACTAVRATTIGFHYYRP